MPKFRHMTWIDRLIIEKHYNSGISFRSIAKATGFSVSSIHTEIQHGLYPHLGAETTKRPFHYSAQIAQDYSDYQASNHGIPIKLGNHYEFCHYVECEVKKGRSVHHIVHSLSFEHQFTVSPSTLYRYIERGYIPGVTSRFLPEHNRKCFHRSVKAARPPKGISIEKRPLSVNDRSQFGHWEMDSVIGKAKGKRQSVIVLTERKTRYEIIVHALSKESASTVKILDKLIPQFPDGTFKTITVDNGCEFQDCYGMEHDEQGNKRLSVYYCHPYTSCERGSNERNNRIIRRFFKKGQSLSGITQHQCCDVADFMNTMRRRVLGWHTASELFNQEILALS